MAARLSSTEVKNRLQKFAKQFKTADNEQRQAQMFWAGFYNCFGISAAEVTVFEQQVRKLDGNLGRIDSFIPGLLIVEHKSKGRDLNAAYEQAQEYFLALKAEERPKYIVTSDFARIVLHDLTANETHETTLEDLPKHGSWFKFLYGDEQAAIVEETPINRNAAYAISKLHEALIRINFKGRDLEIFLTRLLFCLFADDTNIFGDNGQFRSFVENAKADGSDTGQKLYELFDILNTDDADRQSTLDDTLAAFPYVNGSLFAERTRIPVFNSELRELLLTCATLDWSNISPAIFGAMFQGVLEEHATHEKRQATRRELGAHYTSERNILRVINPLFLEELRAEFEAAKKSKAKLKILYDKLPTLTFFDPACGCGNFLVIAYRELRKLENDVIAALFDFDKMRGLLDVATLCRVNLAQFYGIEIDEAAAHIARVALYITDHQQNEQAAKYFGTTRATIPLTATPQVLVGNALRVDWQDVLPASKCSYVFGNPPFIGKQMQTEEQKEDLAFVANKLNNFSLLDYVAAWYIKAASYIKGTDICVAFVSTNSITQGEQVAVLGSWLHSEGVKINFAHRTFRWSNEGKGVAAVHCVIVGFAMTDTKDKFIFNYEEIEAEPVVVKAAQINFYLADAPLVFLVSRRNPICNAPNIVFGNMANDGGYLFITELERSELLDNHPNSAKFIKKFLGADEFINDIDRYCLWLKDATAEEMRAIPFIYDRVQQVKKIRLESQRKSTNILAETPYLFGEIRQTNSPYVLIPLHSSENRKYIPIGFLSADVICGNANSMLIDATLFDFGIVTSVMHMAWVKAVCGRLESRYRYSNTIVYNNYPFPVSAKQEQIDEIEKCSQAVLDARASEEERCKQQQVKSSLAAMYDPLAMPADLVKAHRALDKAVDKAYGYKGADDDASRVAFLFKRYEELTSLLPTAPAKKTKKVKEQ